jgi:GntP family gluconate:H+ symporter
MNSLGWLLVSFIISLVFVLVTIIKFKLNPFLSLIIGGIIMGVITGMPLTKISSTLASGFGGTMGSIGIIIVLGVILGQLLHKSGATEEIAGLMLRATGEKNAPLAINLTGYIVSIPVFFDAAFVILVNLVKSLSRKGKIPFITLVTALAIGLITTHAMVIPTPGPLAVAATMGADIGVFLAYSIPVSLIAALVAGACYGTALGKKKEYAEDYANAFADEEDDVNVGRDASPALRRDRYLPHLPAYRYYPCWKYFCPGSDKGFGFADFFRLPKRQEYRPFDRRAGCFCDAPQVCEAGFW